MVILGQNLSDINVHINAWLHSNSCGAKVNMNMFELNNYLQHELDVLSQSDSL